MLIEADDDIIWYVWPDGTYCMEDEYGSDWFWKSDDFKKLSAKAYTMEGEPIF